MLVVNREINQRVSPDSKQANLICEAQSIKFGCSFITYLNLTDMFQMKNVLQTECLTSLSLTCSRLACLMLCLNLPHTSKSGMQYLSAVCGDSWEIPRMSCYLTLVTLNFIFYEFRTHDLRKQAFNHSKNVLK